MENKIMMPASYNVLSCEEMTYTEGGATVGQAVAAWLWPGYATVIGINTCREARKKDHDNWVSNVWSDIKADCKGNVTNTFYHAGMIFWNAASTISSKSRFFVRTLNQIRKLGLRLCDNTLGFFYGILLFTEKGIYYNRFRDQTTFPSGDLHFTLILSLRNFFLDIVCRSGVGVAIRFAYDK